MKRSIGGFAHYFIFLLLLSLPFEASAAMDKFLALGTSSVRGVYFPVGKGICKSINAGRDEHLVRCIAYNTGGSIYNIQALASGELDLAITRADLAYQAFKGEGPFEGARRNKDIRAIATLYDNPVAIVVRADSGIDSIDQLTGKRINIGNLGSGKRAFSDLLFKVMNWSRSDFEAVSEYSTSKMGQAFCKGEIDALVQVMGIPAKFYDTVVTECGGKFIGFSDKTLSTIRQYGRFFEETVIPGGMYENNAEDIKTIGTKAVLVTTKRLSDYSIYQVAKAIFNDLSAFKKSNRALGSSTIQTMLKEGIFIPMHAGAAKYYDEEGLSYSEPPVLPVKER